MYNIAVVFGGATTEHSISIITAIGAIKNLSLNYHPVPVYINTNGDWVTGKHLLDAAAYQKKEPGGKKCFFQPNSNYLFIKNTVGSSKIRIDCALLCLHGGGGEGGAVQGLLDLTGIPYTSPAVLPSAVCLDKVVSKLLFRSLNIDTPKFVWGEADKIDDLIANVIKKLAFPVIVKPARGGSSVGIRRADCEQKLHEAVKFAAEFDKKIIIEEALVDFRELNISLLRSSGEIKFSSVEEVKNAHDFYTFEDKYLSGDKVCRVVPADIPLKILGKMVNCSSAVYHTLGMSGVVRFDFFVSDNRVLLSEVNTIPGSFAFYLWKNDGISCAQLLNVSLKAARAHAYEEARRLPVKYDQRVLSDLHKIKSFVDK